MAKDGTSRVVMIVVGVVVVALVGYLGTRNAIGSSPRSNMASRLTAAIDLTTPNDIIQIYPKAERGRGLGIYDLGTYHYDFDEVEGLEKRYQGVSRTEFLRGIFARAVKGHDSSDNEKWLAMMDYLSRAMRHPPVEQPMNRDRSVVSDPLMLMLLHEGRCGHQAMVVVDLALTNHYEARLTQLAAHLVAEVKWGGAWHWVDADAGIPVDSLRSRFAELPSLEELARTPYVLDSFASRNWQWGDNARRTVDGMTMPLLISTAYPGDLLTSSVYFGKQIFSGVYGGGGASRNGIIYEYKKGTMAQWETDRSWGWNNLRTEVQPIPMVPVAYAPLQLKISGPEAVYVVGGHTVIPVRWAAQGRPVCQPDQVLTCKLVFDDLGYEVRVSRATRGWDYDFRDYDFMPKSGKGDVLITRDVRKIDGMSFGVDVPVQDVAEVFIEVVPVAKDKAHRSDFMWPSNELGVEVIKPEMPHGATLDNATSATAQPTDSPIH